MGYGLHNLEIAILLPTGRKISLEYIPRWSLLGVANHFEGT
jgi:hypothetical protein